jgi:transcriptional regulator with XRE-family HTH domain
MVPGVKLRGSAGQKAQLASLLRTIREEAGVRQADLAKRLGVGQSVVSKFESGERRLDLLELRQVCAALGVPLVELVKRFEREA